MKYTIVFVLTNTSKYAYVCYHRIYVEIRSYLLSSDQSFNKLTYLNDVLLRHIHVHRQVPEVLDEGSTSSLDGDDTGLDANVDTLGNGHLLVSVDHLHLDEKLKKRTKQIVEKEK